MRPRSVAHAISAALIGEIKSSESVFSIKMDAELETDAGSEIAHIIMDFNYPPEISYWLCDLQEDIP